MSTGGSGNYRETELMTPYLRNSQGSEKREVLAAVTNIIGVIIFSYFYFFALVWFLFLTCMWCACLYMCGCMCVGADAHVFESMWRPEVCVGSRPPSLIYLTH